MNRNSRLKVTYEGDKAILETVCETCGKHSTEVVPKSRWLDFEKFDGYTQDFWTDWEDAKREHFFFPGATCKECWGLMFPAPEDECPEDGENEPKRGEITFEGVTYPVVVIYDNNVNDWVSVSTESLENALLNDKYEIKSPEAQKVDDGILYYVPDEIINRSFDEIAEYVYNI